MGRACVSSLMTFREGKVFHTLNRRARTLAWLAAMCIPLSVLGLSACGGGQQDGSRQASQELAPGAEVSWKAGDLLPYAVAHGGPIEVTLADGSKQRVPADKLLMDVQQWRKARNPGKEPVHLLLSTTPYIDIVPTAPKAH